MTTFYIILVAILLLLALMDLFVGVSNDAVNFLSSAVGSKAFKYKTLMFFAAAGVFFWSHLQQWHDGYRTAWHLYAPVLHLCGTYVRICGGDVYRCDPP